MKMEKKRLKILVSVLHIVFTLLMGITIILQIAAYEPIRHFIMCGCIIMLTIALIFFSAILKNKERVITYIIVGILWIIKITIDIVKSV